MRDGSSDLEAIIARIRAVPGIAKRAAPDVAEAVRVVVERQIADAQSPTGEAWQPRREGGPALQTAAKALVVVPVGSRIYARLRGHIARHHLGRAKGGQARHILPTSGIPRAYAAAIRKTLTAHFERATKGP